MNKLYIGVFRRVAEAPSFLAQHFCQFGEARFKAEPAVNPLSEESNERRIHKRDEDRAGAESMESTCQDKGQHGGKQQHDDIVSELDPVDIQAEAVGNFADKKLVDSDRPGRPKDDRDRQRGKPGAEHKGGDPHPQAFISSVAAQQQEPEIDAQPRNNGRPEGEQILPAKAGCHHTHEKQQDALPDILGGALRELGQPVTERYMKNIRRRRDHRQAEVRLRAQAHPKRAAHDPDHPRDLIHSADFFHAHIFPVPSAKRRS